MKPGLRIMLSALLLAASLLCVAQTTKVRGRVTDEHGEGIPFVGVFFKGTTTGITTDLDGYYNLECRDLSATVLVAQLLGYDTREITVHPGVFSEVDFVLPLTDNRLTGAKVKADNKKARALLAGIQKNRYRNDPDSHPEFTCDVYNKMELDLTHPAEQLDGKRFRREFGFVFDYIDTSAVSGVPYLPVMISETLSERRHSSRPEVNTETIKANRISGINADGNNMLSQFTGSMHLKINFYKPFINAFDVAFPSPIQEGGLVFYNYYIIDTLMVDGRKTLLVRYHPKSLVSTPTFDGEMRIDVEDFALRSIHANMKNTTNVNWLRDLVLDAEYERQPDSTWFYKSDRLYVDLSLSLRDSSKLLSFIGRKEMTHSNVRFSLDEKPGSGGGIVRMDRDASHKDESFWAEARPSPLTEKEQAVYEMVDRVKTVPLYKSLYDIVYTLVNGYYEMGKIEIGPYHKLYSRNALEGSRPQIGIRTSKEFSRSNRYTLYGAVGTKDHKLKGGVTWEHLWSRDPESKLTLDAKYDTYQLGSSLNTLSEGNILATIFGGSHGNRLTMMSAFSGNYKRELSMMFNAEAGFDFRRYYSSEKSWVKDLYHVPMYAPDGSAVPGVAANEMYVSLRMCKDETVNRGLYTKKYVYSDYPAITVTLAGSVPGLRKNDFGYFRPEVTVRWNPRVPPFGISRIYINAGKIYGKVPYPLLHIHEGNNTYMYDRFAFSCMEYMEFASDEWITIFYNHCFNGFFFGKIPVIRKFGWREEFSFKASWGWLSDKNNGDIGRYTDASGTLNTAAMAAGMQAPLQFPKGTSALYADNPEARRLYSNTPYIEFGAGVSNILKFIRVDCFWRVTHKNDRHVVEETETTPPGGGLAAIENRIRRIDTSNFTVQIGAEFKF